MKYKIKYTIIIFFTLLIASFQKGRKTLFYVLDVFYTASEAQIVITNDEVIQHPFVDDDCLEELVLGNKKIKGYNFEIDSLTIYKGIKKEIIRVLPEEVRNDYLILHKNAESGSNDIVCGSLTSVKQLNLSNIVVIGENKETFLSKFSNKIDSKCHTYSISNELGDKTISFIFNEDNILSRINFTSDYDEIFCVTK